MTGKPKNFSQAIEDLESQLRPHLDDLSEFVSDEAKKAKDKIEDQVQKNPIMAIGIVALVCFVLGFLFASRGSRK